MPPRVVVAPDKFKGSCTAREAADAIVLGLRDAWADAVSYVVIPLADGGDGTVAAFLDAGATPQHARSVDALGAPVDVTYARSGTTAILEMAAASGLARVGERRAARLATTFGTGLLIADALAHGATRIVLGIGGSATTDGGAGALAALGVRFLDAAGALLEPAPAALAALAAIDASGLDPRLAHVPIEIACDVDNPLLGPTGAAAVYGPQKGAGAADVAFLDGVLRALGRRRRRRRTRSARHAGRGRGGRLGLGAGDVRGRAPSARVRHRRGAAGPRRRAARCGAVRDGRRAHRPPVARRQGDLGRRRPCSGCGCAGRRDRRER